MAVADQVKKIIVEQLGVDEEAIEYIEAHAKKK